MSLVSNTVQEKVADGFTGRYYYGLGRRKRAIAQVRVFVSDAHTGDGVVNGVSFSDYFSGVRSKDLIFRPLSLVGLLNRAFVSARVHGGGKSGQADAVSLGIARALVEYNGEFKKVLKDAGFLTRDAREKERKKYNLLKARKAHQYTKR